VDPTALTLALVAAAEQNGVSFQFNTPVTAAGANQLTTPGGPLEFDWLVVAAGVGSTPFANASQHPLEIRPVLGQAMQVQLSQPLGHPDWQPVITGEDVHLVPLGGGSYWVGATVEFAPPGNGQEQSFQPDPAQLEDILHQAIARFPALASATILRRWYGFRPRPEGRPAPVIERVPGHPTVILATGHYRNGVLLAPATAAAVRDMLITTDSFDQNTATGAGGPYEKKIPDGKPGI
jgi:glycine/D-amino acid oxidase-like deaminating enzyme